MNNEERLRQIRDRLTAELTPSHLDVVDESHRHAGHAGAETGMGHFAVSIQSPLFSGKSSVQCHRLIYEALGTMMETEIHALRISIPRP